MQSWVNVVLRNSEVGRSLPDVFVSLPLLYPMSPEERRTDQKPSFLAPLSAKRRHEEVYLVAFWKMGKTASWCSCKAKHSTEETEAERRSSTHSPPEKGMEIISDCVGEDFSFGRRNDKLRKDEKVHLLTVYKWQLSLQIHLKSDRDLCVGGRAARMNSHSSFVHCRVTSEAASTSFMLLK